MDDLDRRYERLRDAIRATGGAAVAFSSGVDSTLVLWAAHEALGDAAVAYTATSPIFPPYETDEAQAFCREHGIRQVEVEVDPFSIEGYADNPPDRCYRCKRHLFERLIAAARADGFAHVLDGTNADDTGAYRPGMRALAELGVESPLRDAGLAKADIRELSSRLGLPTATKPSFACLMTRFQYGDRVDAERLRMVAEAELALIDEGFRQVRVRFHEGGVARIELGPGEASRLLEDGRAARVDERLRGVGFSFVTLDLGGYATGKMNAETEAALLREAEGGA